jgi:hypothetical protein
MAQTYSDNYSLAHPKPEFEHYRKNVAGSYEDWDDTADVISNVPAGRRPHKTYRINGSDFICESDGLTFTAKSSAASVTTLTLTADDSFVLLAGSRLIGLLVNNNQLLTDFRVGLTSGGEEFVSSQELAATGAWYSFPLLYKSSTNTTLYFYGITGTVNIDIIKL